MSSLSNFLLFLEYDGTGYSGWQKQPGLSTIQGELEKAFGKIGLAGARTTAAGRTDGGVHAEEQAVSVKVNKSLERGFDLRYRLNSVLPKNISVISAEKLGRPFNPRFEAVKKRYKYVIWNRQWRSVWGGRNAWHIVQELDVSAMRKAAAYLEGKHDFSSFDASGSTQPNKTAKIEQISIKKSGGNVVISFTADRFLYKMVRNMTGTLVATGRGRMAPEKVKAILEARNRPSAGQTAPAKGLFLEKVFFHEKRKKT